jgi:hypothetical protein
MENPILVEQAILGQLLSNNTPGTDRHDGEMYRQSLLRIHAICMAEAEVSASGNFYLSFGTGTVYKRAYTWAMEANHIGILEILDDLGFFNLPDDDFLNDEDALELLSIAVRKCNLEALAFTMNRMMIVPEDVTIDYLLLIITDILSVHQKIGICGTYFGIGSVEMLRAIRAMFLILKRLLFGGWGWVITPPITIHELRPIKHNADAMALFLHLAASLNTPSHQTVDTLLQTGIYTQDELEDAIEHIQRRGRNANPTWDLDLDTIGKLRAAMPWVPERGPYTSHAAIAQRRLIGRSGPCPSCVGWLE